MIHLDYTNENDYYSASQIHLANRTPDSIMKFAATALLCFLASLTAAPALANNLEIALSIREHRFEPAEVKVPAGQKIKLLVTNHDSTPEEFESHEMNREKLIPAGKTVTIFIGPLKPGRYHFFGEFNEKTARGVVIAE